VAQLLLQKGADVNKMTAQRVGPTLVGRKRA
jgi:hypothetical protein